MCSINNMSFKSHDDALGFDDVESVSKRAYIREHYIDHLSPYYSVLENNGRLSEYQLNKLMSGLLGQKVDVKSLSKLLPASVEPTSNEVKSTFEIMQSLPLRNVKPIPTVQSYRGSTPAGNLAVLPTLKEAGIKKVVDLHGYDVLAEACEECALDYLFFRVTEEFEEQDVFLTREQFIRKMKPFYSIAGANPNAVQEQLDRAVAKWDVNLKQFFAKFVDFIQTMQSENVYIGCEYGTSRTNNALMLNHFFNPKAQKTPNCITKHNFGLFQRLDTLYKNLSDLDKSQMGWTEEFDKNFLLRLKKVRAELKF